MSDRLLPQHRQRIRKRAITPSQPPASTHDPVYSFEECTTPGCMQLHVPAATGSTKCPECVSREVRA